MRNGHTTFKAAGKISMRISMIALRILYFLAASQVMGRIWQERYLPVTLLYLFTLEIAWLLLEACNITERRILDLVYGQFFGAVCANIFFGALICASAGLSFGRIMGEFFLLTLLEAVTGMLWAALFFFWYLERQSFKKALFVYGNREEYAQSIEKNNRINGYFKIREAVHFGVGMEALEVLVKRYEAVYLGDIPYEVRNRLMKLCIRLHKDCYSVPKISDIYIQNARILRLHDQVLFKYHGVGLAGEQEKIKRTADVCCALVLFVLAAPVMAVIAACIYAEDGSPVLYRQKRLTKGGREFEMLKFRSMRRDAEKEGIRMASKNDDRITKVGRVIRNLHFDELPQLFNVLKGDMSLVGPRPERREFIEEYAKAIPEFRERLKVRGGLTGYAQIYGKYNTGPEDKIKYDLIYIYNYSLRLDIRLLFLTVRILFQKENAEGVEEGQRNALKTAEGKKDINKGEG